MDASETVEWVTCWSTSYLQMNLRLYVALGWKPEYTIQSRVIQLPWSKWGFSTGTVQLVGREVQLELPAKKFTYATELESLWINVRKSWQKGNKVLELTLFEAYLNYIFLDRSEQKWKNNRWTGTDYPCCHLHLALPRCLRSHHLRPLGRGCQFRSVSGQTGRLQPKLWKSHQTSNVGNEKVE